MKKLYEIVKIFDIEPIFFQSLEGDDNVIHYRLEVLYDYCSKQFFGKIYRKEFYRIQPTFPQLNGIPAESHKSDECFFVEDAFCFLDSLKGKSEHDVIEKFQYELDKYLDKISGNINMKN